MKATGIVRRIDYLGRICIPKELRKVLNIKVSDPLEMFTENNGEIILKKYEPSCACVFCGEVEHVWAHKGKNICQTCINTLAGCATTNNHQL